VDLSRIDFEKLRNEFANKVRRKHAAIQDIREVVEKKLAQMLAHNLMRMDYFKKYQEIIADYSPRCGICCDPYRIGRRRRRPRPK
jgi:type I restriction enzyme, R subunit